MWTCTNTYAYRHVSHKSDIIKATKTVRTIALTTYFMCDRVNVLEKEAPIPDIAKQNHSNFILSITSHAVYFLTWAQLGFKLMPFANERLSVKV